MKRLTELVGRLRNGSGLRAQLARGAFGGMGAILLGIATGFLVQAAIARMVGAAEFGVYSWVLAWINTLLLVSCSGLDGLVVRKLPAYLIDGAEGRLRGLLRFSGWWSGAVSVVLGTAACVLAWAYSERMLPGALPTLIIGACVLPLFALGSLRQSILRALKHVVKGQILDAVVRPLLLLGCAAIAIFGFGFAGDARTIMTAQLLASLAVFIIGGYWVLAALPRQSPTLADTRDWRVWLREAFPFLAISGASAISKQVGVLLLGSMGTAAETGIYAAAAKIADFSLMGVYAVSAIASPMLVEALKRDNRAAIAQIMRLGTRATFAFAIAVALAIALLGDWVLAMFGKEFTAGTQLVLIILCGQMMWAFAGLSGFLLSMAGHAGSVARVGWAAAIANALVCWYFIPIYGARAAAAGYALMWLVHGVMGIVLCKRHLGVWAGLR